MAAKTLRVHVLGIPHTATSPIFSGCAFTQKVRKLVRLLAEDNPASSARYEVVHYGCERSEVHPSAEHVAVTPWDLLETTYGREWWMRRVPYGLSDAPNTVFRVNAIREMRSRVRPNDIVLASWGSGHEPITREFPQAIVVEPGIGYPVSNAFAPYKVFESYAYMNYLYGARGIANPSWYDAVIPNWFDLAEFDFTPEQKEDYLLFIGRIQEDKGLRVYVQLAEQLGFKLVVGGHGRLADLGIRPPKNVEEVGFCGVEKRRRLMSRARGYLLFSTYVEPFGGAAVEAMLSGTPVVTSDVGAFPETVLHGVTGYRCRTFDQLVWAVRNIDRIDPQACRAWAEANYSTSRIRLMFDEYLGTLHQQHTDDRGWYARDHERGPLKWLEKEHPPLSMRIADWPAGTSSHTSVSADDDATPTAPTVHRTPYTATAVTALYDIGREGIDGRRWRDYLSWFERTLALRVPMIVYVPPDLVRFVETARGDQPTRIVARPEPPLFDRIERFDRASAALRALDRRLPNGSWRLEALSPRYLATVWSKLVWMREALDLESSRETSLVWIDAGLSRFFGDMNLSAPWPHPSWRETFAANRVVIEGHPGMRDAIAGRRVIDAAIVGTSEPLIPGGCWGGSRAAVAVFCDRMLAVLEEMLREGRVDNEQVGTALLWSREPELLDVQLRDAEMPSGEIGWLEIAQKLARPTDSSDLRADRPTTEG